MFVYTWKKTVFCLYWLEHSINVNYVKLFSVAQLFYILIDFLSVWSMNICPFNLFRFCSMYFEALLSGAYVLRIVLSPWWIDSFNMKLLALDFVPKSILCGITYRHSSCFMLSYYHMTFPSFCFSHSCAFIFKMSFLLTA